MAFIPQIPSRTVDLWNDYHTCSCPVPQGKWTLIARQIGGLQVIHIKGLVKINLTSEKGIGPWRQRLFLPWQNSDSTEQHKTSFPLILCNPQLEQLILQGGQAPFLWYFYWELYEVDICPLWYILTAPFTYCWEYSLILVSTFWCCKLSVAAVFHWSQITENSMGLGREGERESEAADLEIIPLV